jgi:predicted nucleotidyltransferase
MNAPLETVTSDWVMADRQTRRARAVLLQAELERITARLIALGAQRIVVFGSLAAGEVGAASDIDMVVVIPSPLSFVKRLGWLYTELEPRTALDLLPYTPDEFRTMQYRPFLRRALHRGILLYETGS